MDQRLSLVTLGVSDLDFIAVNDLTDTRTLAHLLPQHAHGPLDGVRGQDGRVRPDLVLAERLLEAVVGEQASDQRVTRACAAASSENGVLTMKVAACCT